MDANLAAIESQEENVYIQHRHNGDKAWIGLNDIATEGLFSWVDGCPDKFRYWAQNQPNDFRGEDCVHTLGAGHGYMWNDVDCSACHQYTCKKGSHKLVSVLLDTLSSTILREMYILKRDSKRNRGILLLNQGRWVGKGEGRGKEEGEKGDALSYKLIRLTLLFFLLCHSNN